MREKLPFNPKEIDDFARYYGFHYDCIDKASLLRDFCVDMERGLRGESSSMPMIPSHLSPVYSAPAGKTVVAFDAGGTNLRVSRVQFDESGRPVPVITERAPMPGTRGRLSAEEFYDALAHTAAPCFKDGGEIAGIGFCFSYEMTVTKDGDGIPTAMSKEVDAPEVMGKSLGAGLRGALKKLGIHAPERIIFLNDTTATLLSGIAQIPARYADKTTDGSPLAKDRIGIESGEVMGFILGTGLNTAYPEKNIPKIGFSSNERPQIIVAESGAYNPRCLGRLDREFDALTTQPGFHTLEKAAAGAYLGPLSLYIIKKAVEEKLLRFEKQDELLAMPKLETRDLNEFLHRPLALEGRLGSLFSKNEHGVIAALCYLESIITERAALLAAGLIAGTAERIEAGYDPLRPFRIAIEGTTYVRYHHIRESIEARLRELLCRDTPRFYITATVDQASLFGAAVGALSL
ncbi:MAG: hexokinase [Spirochaetaceae bacterium]|jgi:hexokinase|nr:hexokinase [Spirochaetaceae bacterium]